MACIQLSCLILLLVSLSANQMEAKSIGNKVGSFDLETLQVVDKMIKEVFDENKEACAIITSKKSREVYLKKVYDGLLRHEGSTPEGQKKASETINLIIATVKDYLKRHPETCPGLKIA